MSDLYRCPSCLRFLRRPARREPAGSSPRWSDGYAGPSPHDLMRCGFCLAFLWLEDLPPQRIRHRRRLPIWPLRPLGRDEYALALRLGLADSPRRERILRLRLWHMLNHRFRGGARRPAGGSFRSNLLRLAALLDPERDRFLQAELAREAGLFEQALELCGDDPGLEQIRVRAEGRDRQVFELK